MFSAIGNVFAPKPRHAETTDTRQEIQRHDPEYERRKRKKRDDDTAFGFDEDDSAIVSVDALQVFLENFLKSQIEMEAETKTETGPKTEPHQETPEVFTPPPMQAPETAAAATIDTATARPVNRAAMAANAYQHGAQATRSNAPQMPDTAGNNANPLGLKAQDMRLIHDLLRDLKLLAERHVEYLHIERSENFLQSLVNAVEKIK